MNDVVQGKVISELGRKNTEIAHCIKDIEAYLVLNAEAQIGR